MDRLSALPDDILQQVALFSIKSLKELFRARLISKHFRTVLSGEPELLSCLWFKFKTCEDVLKLGRLSSGIRRVRHYGGRSSEISHAMWLMPDIHTLFLHDLWISTEDFNSALSHLTKLNKLSVACLNLVESIRLPPSVHVLHAQGCSALKSIHAAANLSELHVSYCTQLRAIPNHELLIELKMAGCRLQVPDLMPKLRHLETDFMVLNPHRPHAIASCTTLEEVRMYSISTAGVAFLSPLKQLRTVVLWQCNALQDLRGLSGLYGLTQLHLVGCRLSDMSLLSLEPLCNVNYLELGTDNITNAGLSSIAKLLNLKQLHINCCTLTSSGLRRLAPLQSLEVFHLTRAFYVTDITALNRLANLRQLQFSSLIQLGSVQPLSALKGLVSLTLEHCRALRSLEGLAGLPALNHITLENCDALTREGLWALEPDTSAVTSFVVCERMRHWLSDDLCEFYKRLGTLKKRVK